MMNPRVEVVGRKVSALEPSNQFMRLDQKFLSKAKNPRRDFGQLEVCRREGMRLLEEGMPRLMSPDCLGFQFQFRVREKRVFYAGE